MPTKRKRTPRKAVNQVTSKALDLYRRGKMLAAAYNRCSARLATCTHSACDEFREISDELRWLLKLAPHQPDPFDSHEDIKRWPLRGDGVAAIKDKLETALKSNQTDKSG